MWVMIEKMKKTQGFTLVELLMTIALVAILAVLSISVITQTSDEARFDLTVQQMKEIRNAMVGNPSMLNGTHRSSYGYLGDVGAIPTTAQGISALITKPAAISAWAYNSTVLLGIGWKTAYLNTGFTAADYTKDAWGTAYVYSSTATPPTLTSYGSDRVAGGTGFAQDITVQIPTTLINTTLHGVILQTGGAAWDGSAQIELNAPDGTGALSQTLTTISAGANGAYTVSTTLGVRSITLYVPSKAVATQTSGPYLINVDGQNSVVDNLYVTSAVVTPPGGCAGTKQVLTYTGADQTVTTPTGCTNALVKMWGGGGGGATFSGTKNGGGGGYVTAIVPVATLSAATFMVGGAGIANPSTVALNPAVYGGGASSLSNGLGAAGSGGGRSAIISSGTDVLTAGGGGGSGNTFGGGAGGGSSGLSPTVSFGTAPGGGTQVAAGAGGVDTQSGNAGSGHNGGTGGINYGGGGGGWFGGGGGGWRTSFVQAGGGGSSYVGTGTITSGSTIAASASTAGNSTDSDNSGAGAGGVGNTIGAAGRIVIYWYGSSSVSTVTAVTPVNGPLVGGQTITITGTNFIPGTTPTVTVGGGSCTSVTVINPTTLTCRTPSHAGVVSVVADIVVDNGAGAGTATLLGGDGAGNVTASPTGPGYSYVTCVPKNDRYASTGADQYLSPPLGCTVATVELWGGAGGGATTHTGGGGGYVAGHITLVDNAPNTYLMMVGSGGVPDPTGGASNPAVYGGGGASFSSGAGIEGSGGGRTTIQYVLGTDLITAGGGGGGSNAGSGGGGGNNGSNAGLPPVNSFGTAATGGTQAAAGAGGIDTNGTGLPGSGHNGGGLGAGAPLNYSGGGGGYFGGGSGGYRTGSGQGAAGGSSYIGDGVTVTAGTNTVGVTGGNAGNAGAADLTAAMSGLSGVCGSTAGNGVSAGAGKGGCAVIKWTQ